MSSPSTHESHRTSIRSLEHLAADLSEHAQISFDLHQATLFGVQARGVIDNTRRSYRALLRSLNERTQATQGIEVLLDNFYIIESALSDLSLNWKHRDALRVPQSSDVVKGKLPRVYVVARALIEATNGAVDRESIISYLKAYQRHAPLSVRELDLFPDMLRYALLEETARLITENLTLLHEVADAEEWHGRIMRVIHRKDASAQIKKVIGNLSSSYAIIPQAFGLHLLHRLMQSGKEGEIRTVEKWLKLSLSKQGASATQLSAQSARLRQAQAKKISNIIASLRYLAQVRWGKMSLELNMVNAILAKDPAGSFDQVSDETRMQYQETIARIADKTGSHDVEVAREAIRLARQASEGKRNESVRARHVGYFLVDDGVATLETVMGYVPTYVERVQAAVKKHGTITYLGFLGTVMILIDWVLLSKSGVFDLPFVFGVVIGGAGLILTSEIAVALGHVLFTRLLKPRPIASLDLSLGVGPGRRTFVVVPSMFRNAAATAKVLRRMETNFIGNKDPDIYYALLMDFRDADACIQPGDQERVAECVRGIAELNTRYPSSTPRFSLFYQQRKWNDAEGVFMGWERKRGKLREFNELLRGKETSYGVDAIAQAAVYGRVQYVITLDEDTELVRDAAPALIGTITHPLNKAIIDPETQVVREGYGIIVPRTALRFEEGNTSAFARLFGSFPGIDAYSTLVSDLHQDLFGEAMFHGKGIYDVDAVESTMAGRFPENRILSHDLIEGLYARVGIASGAHIFEGFPSNYREHMQRLHRWVRGDWQIIQWVFSARGEALSLIARYRIFDNLRRSLLPVAASVVLVCVVFSPATTSLWSLVVLLAIGSGQLVSSLISLTEQTVDWRRRLSFRARVELLIVGLGIAVAKTLLLGVFALHNAVVTIDAVVRSMWRLFISHRHLLEWQTAHEAAAGRTLSVQQFVRFMWRSVCFALFLIFIEFHEANLNDGFALAWISSWVFAPAFGVLVSMPLSTPFAFSSAERLYLRKAAARTYWFFLDLATKEEQWLVPDHLQEEPAHKRHSHGIGISPTNLGMYLLALSSARVLGLSALPVYTDRIALAITSMRGMERYRGHFFNWYELRHLTPLAPKYISSVDSANLALSLRAVSGAINEARVSPVLDRSMFEGLEAQLAVLQESINVLPSQDLERNERRLIEEIGGAVESALVLVRDSMSIAITPRGCDIVLSGVVHHSIRVRNALESLRLEGETRKFDEVFLAARQVEAAVESHRQSIILYLDHAMIPATSAIANDPKLHGLHLKVATVLSAVPNIEELAQGVLSQKLAAIGVDEAIALSQLAAVEKERARAWYAEVLSRLARSEGQAKETERSLRTAAASIDEFARSMDFTFLYNEERGLFHVGYNGATGQLDESFYDLLASEANSASIVSIAQRDVPQKHWSYLGRKLVKSKRGDTLVASWAGSLFEYLGTQLYFDIPRESFWGVSAQRAVAAHQFFAKRYAIPWGMGESASARLDATDTYHYQAFGEPSLGFKRDLSESIVVAPYTSALSLSLAPRASLENLERIAQFGGAGAYGFYDAIDFTSRRRRSASGGVGIPARVYYAHHQGFILSSITNALTDGWVRRMVATDPSMESVTQLFEEKMPEGVEGEAVTAVVAPMRGVRTEHVALDVQRQYLPWRSKESNSLFLSHGAYHTRITTSGAGESSYGDVLLTRECADALRESTGTFFYLHDAARQLTWSPTYMPTQDVGEKQSVSAIEQSVVFEKSVHGIDSTLIVTALPKDEGEVRELSILNTTDQECTVSFGVCAELSLVRSGEESSHPHYARLFVASESVWGEQAILASRPDTKDRMQHIAAGFLLTTDRPVRDQRAIRSKKEFYGSPQRLATPRIFTAPNEERSSSPVHTLDPVAAFTGTVKLRPGETRRIALVIAGGRSPQGVAATLRSYRDYKVIQKIIAGRERLAAQSLVESGVTAVQASIYGDLASLALARRWHNHTGISPDTTAWVSVLWKMGISGNRPIILLSVTGVTDLPVIRQLLSCHSYFTKKGIAVDVILFNEHAGGYLKTFEDEIDFLLHMYQTNEGRSESAIFHVRAEQLSVNEQRSLRATAVVCLDAKKGSLVDAIRNVQGVRTAKYPARFEGVPSAFERKDAHVHSRSLTRLQLENSFGGYDPHSKEYVIRSGGAAHPPRPWSQIVANDRVGFLATDRGMTFTWTRNSYDNKLTVPHNDQLADDSGEVIYLRDEETGQFVNLLSVDAPRREVRYGEAHASYLAEVLGIQSELVLSIDADHPVKYFRLRLTNEGPSDRLLSCVGYFEVLMGSIPRESKKHLRFEVLPGNILVAQQLYRHQFLSSRLFAGVAGGADEFTVSREEFLGRNGSTNTPAALWRKGLTSQVDLTGEPALAFLKRVRVPSGKSVEVMFFLGEADEPAVSQILSQCVLSTSLKQGLECRSSLPICDLPDESLNVLMNRFLPQQISSSRLHGRLGFSQIGGAYGFRDQLQDALAVLWYDPSWVRAHILHAAAHQFSEGDVLSWWQPHNEFGARTRLSDLHLWLPYVTLRYVASTGDESLLDEVLPYMEGEIPDKADRPSVVGVFHPGTEHGPLYEHLIRATERGLTFGPHGLPLMGSADWNDGMNQVGPEGAGESVWLAWLTVIVLDEMSVLVRKRGDIDRAVRYEAHAAEYRAALQQHGWDGRWYRRAFTDSGAIIGTTGAKSFRLDSIAQSWAFFANGNTKETITALRSAKDELSIYDGHVPLAWPPSSRARLDMGTISDYPPGVRENASQYNHAALWLAQAYFASGDADTGMIILNAVNPFKRSATQEQALQYQGEPYVIAAEIYSAPTYPGRAGWTWYTASAGVFYRTIMEQVLGLKQEGATLAFAPSFPSDWSTASVTIPYGKAQYRVTYVTGGSPGILVALDGRLVAAGKITLIDDGQIHQVNISMGQQGGQESVS